MLSYLFIGANDIDASARFYDAILLPLGYEKESSDGQHSYSLSDIEDKSNGPGTVHVAKPFDGQPATVGNGMMPAFRADSRNQVENVHAAGLANGGADEGSPGTRAAYTAGFYVAYLRDPVGNKVAVFFSS
ncbi:MAG: VOC family protein [Pseudomonas sp.]|uniref:VOC family protein n=1 Tax=Pseudomonas sp. TaxID=306 RepID=UPI003D6E5CCE